ncbi:hypothetical protein EV424DRAFT_1347163 [Suillus variegatus]|nr:hypothetical protein EV424DRAFT_1347163 [Suillus variegatus]
MINKEIFQKVLWAWDGSEDSTGDARRAWNLLDVICRILELAGYHDPSYHIMRNLKLCRKLYSRTRSSKQNDASVLLVALRNVLHFTFAAANISRDSAELWYASPFWAGPPEDFDWMVDYLNDIYSDDHEAAYDILLLLGSIRGSYNPAKHHMFIENLIACMDSNIPFHLRHAALRAAHSAREEIASIDAIDDARLRTIVLTNLSPAIIMIPKYCNSEYYSQHAFCIAGILLRIAPEQTSDTSLDSVTEQQWWDMMRCVWYYLPYIIRETRDSKLLVFVDRTKKYMQIASKSSLEIQNLIGKVDDVLKSMEPEIPPEVGLNMQGLEQAEGFTIAVKDLRTVASNMLDSVVQPLVPYYDAYRVRTLESEKVAGQRSYDSDSKPNQHMPPKVDMSEAHSRPLLAASTATWSQLAYKNPRKVHAGGRCSKINIGLDVVDVTHTNNLYISSYAWTIQLSTDFHEEPRLAGGCRQPPTTMRQVAFEPTCMNFDFDSRSLSSRTPGNEPFSTMRLSRAQTKKHSESQTLQTLYNVVIVIWLDLLVHAGTQDVGVALV